MLRLESADRWNINPYLDVIKSAPTSLCTGVITELVGLLVESDGPATGVGDFCEVRTADGRRVRTQVVGFRRGKVLSMPLEETGGLQLGDRVIARAAQANVAVSKAMLGRVLDGFGLPMDGLDPYVADAHYPMFCAPPGPLERAEITKPLATGIKVIDSMLTCGEGQRIGIFGGSGVGKSTLMGAICRQNSADVSVIAMIGERNREVRGFIERDLGPEGLKRSVLVVSTSDRPAPLRIRAAFVALAVAEYFRDQGARVLLFMDSVTRLAMAQREIGLAAGEPPSQKGYTPSVFNLLPKILERAGNFKTGSITGYFTVLVEGDDFNEPICDSVRGIVDGHIILSRELGSAGHYPAIDVLQSISRLANQISTPEQKESARKIREAMSAYRRSEDLIRLGAYASGSDPALDSAIRVKSQLDAFLRQDAHFSSGFDVTLRELQQLAAHLK